MIVDGPASVKLVSGKAEVYGYLVRDGQRVVAREGKRLPFFVLETAVFDLSLGANAAVEQADSNTIPSSWDKPFEAISAVRSKPVTILVLGKGDSGKSSYCTYLLNKLVAEKCRVAVLDGDLGQSDIGASGTVAYALASKPTADLYELKVENAFFVGVTSPILAVARTMEGLTVLKNEIQTRPVDFIVVNTDGWVAGDVALHYKTALIKQLKPGVIVAVQVAGELVDLIANIGQPVVTVEASCSLSPRTSEKRRVLREMTYARYMKDAKLQCYPISQLTIEPAGALPKNQSPEKGVLVGLYGYGNNFLGIGVLREINWARRALKIQTPVSAKPSRIAVGKVYLDFKLRELQD